METIKTQLVNHPYDEVFLKKNCCPNFLKDVNFDWNDFNDNTDHEYAELIAEHDVVASLRDIDTEEDYAFFFLSKETKSFCLKKVIVDEKMSEPYLAKTIKQILRML